MVWYKLSDKYGSAIVYRQVSGIIQPTVSVLLSVHNGGEWLRESVQSILGQSFKGFELIIVNDGSTDCTGSVIHDFIVDPRVVLVEQERMGLTRTLNRALGLARGQFIARQDADDISLPERFERQLAYFVKYPTTVMVGAHSRRIGETPVEFRPTPALEPDEIRSILHDRNIFCHGTVMIDRVAAGEELHYNDTFRYAQDVELWCRFARKFELRILPEALYLYRISKKSITTLKLEEQCIYTALAIEAGRHKFCAYPLNSTDRDSMLRDMSNEARKILCRVLLINEAPRLAANFFPAWHPARLALRLMPSKGLRLMKRIRRLFCQI